MEIYQIFICQRCHVIQPVYKERREVIMFSDNKIMVITTPVYNKQQTWLNLLLNISALHYIITARYFML